jgi:hypothetical protein
MTSETNYQLLIRKLDEFIRKYYKNLLIKGALYGFMGLMIAFLSVIILEHYGQFSTSVRSVLFYSFILFSGFILLKYIAVPLAHLYRLGKVISYDQAAQIIGSHFPGIKDRLLNTLQLKHLADEKGPNAELIEASINQKINGLRPVPFTAAINLGENYRYLKYAAVPLLCLIIIQIIAPGMISGSSERLIKYDTFFEKPAPFSFLLQNKSLETVQNEDFDVEVMLDGNEVPAEVYLEINGNKYKMERQNASTFRYTFKNPQKNIPFMFTADKVYSKELELKVLPKPLLLNFDVKLEYPAYLNKRSESLENNGDLTIPAGTRVNWKFLTRDVELLVMRFGDTTLAAGENQRNNYSISRRFFKNNHYYVKTSNSLISGKDSILYNITVIPDAFPAIKVEERKDSVNDRLLYFLGNISDDYGFQKLSFNYRFIRSDDSAKQAQPLKIFNISISPAQADQPFYHYWNMDELNIKAADQIEYYFEVWDNDGVNGSKSVRSKMMEFKAPTLEELKKKGENSNEKLKDKMDEAIKETRKLQKDIDALQKKLHEKKTLTWDDKKQIEKLLEKQKQLQQTTDELKLENQKNNKEQSEYREINEDILKKQEEVQRIFEEVLDDETKEMFKNLEQLLRENNKDKIQEELDKMQLSDKEVEKQLDRMLELFKKLEVEQKVKDAIDKLDKLAKEQEKLSDESKNKDADQKELKEKQDKLNKEFEELKKDLKDAEEKNKELEDPADLENTEQEQEEIQQDMEESSKELKEGKNKKASENQKSASQKMKAMKDKLQKSMESSEQEQEAEDYRKLREILENLVQLSFDQEELMEQFKSVTGYNPQFVALSQTQKKLKDDARIIEDSLLALSKRVIAIQSFINKEIGMVNSNMEKAIKDLGDRNVYSARNRQQYVMTSLNNLAVMLSESLKKMQEDMSGKMSGTQMCQKPGKGKPSMGQLKKMQQELNKQLEDMKNGQKPGGKEGQSGIPSSQWAKSAAQQQALRKYMQELQEQMKKEGVKPGGTDRTKELMEETEKDLVNKRLTPETIRRQQEILTRLLESEKAEKERETDNKRESNEGSEDIKVNPPSLEEYLKLKNSEQELLKTIPPALSPYYKNKTREYFKKIETK